MSRFRHLAVVGALALQSSSHATLVVPGLINTGQDSAPGTIDINYPVTSAPLSLNTTVANPFMGWLANSASSKWVSPYVNSSGNALHDPNANTSPRIYDYKFSFDLTGYDPAQTSISGRWAVDNTAQLLLNGNSIGVTTIGTPTFSNLNATFNLASPGFIAGANTITFRVTNAAQSFANPTGLRVEFLSSSTAAVPELSSVYSLGGLLLLGGCVFACRKLILTLGETAVIECVLAAIRFNT